MASLQVSVFVLLMLCLSVKRAEDLTVGTSISNQLVYTENVKLTAIPFTERTKNVFYNDNNTRIIKGVWAVDLDKTKARATITSGGVGSPFVNVRIKGERGEGLNYQVQVFV